MRAKNIRLLAVAVSSLVVSVPTWADTPEDIPEHTIRNIRLTVMPADAIVVGTVLGIQGEGPHAKVKFKVDQTVLGTVPAELETSLDGFYAPELENGQQLIIPLKKLKAKDRFACTGRYELVHDGRVRDHSLDAYIGAMTAEIQKVTSERALAKRPGKAPAAPAAAAQPAQAPAANDAQPVAASGGT